MSGQFQYFVAPKVAGKPTVSLEECGEFGLSYAFDAEHKPISCGCTHGPRPDGAAGIVLCASSDRIGYYPERQKWRAMQGNPDVWVGMELQHVPTPEDIARKRQADGEVIKGRNGSQWLIPRARQWDDFDGALLYRLTLPAAIDIDDSGEMVRGEVLAEYRELWRLASAYSDGEEVAIADLLTAAIGANYRAGITELILLGLVDTSQSFFKSALDVVLDEQRGLELLKKRGEPTGVMSNGSSGASRPTTDDQPDIDRQSQSRERGRLATIEAGAA